MPAWRRQDFPRGGHPVQGEATALQSAIRASSSALDARVISENLAEDYASPAKRLFFMMACTPQLPSTTCVMP